MTNKLFLCLGFYDYLLKVQELELWSQTVCLKLGLCIAKLPSRKVVSGTTSTEVPILPYL